VEKFCLFLGTELGPEAEEVLLAMLLETGLEDSDVDAIHGSFTSGHCNQFQNYSPIYKDVIKD